MPVCIKRSWGVHYKSLLARPRVSQKVSEYVFEFIDEHLLRPRNVLQGEKYTYVFTLSFMPSIPKNRAFPFPYTSPFATGTRLFFGQKGFRTVEKTEKWATLAVIADDIDQTITPYEYAIVVFYLFADFLLYNYRKFEKSDFDQLLQKLDKSLIESYPFPASFEEQSYSLDDIEFPVIPLNYGYEWIDSENWVTIHPKNEYLKHYSF